jgi:aspartyl-tRNA(Asn)/glutamyl-tRNA(Gln) amidotransferase subunit C
LRAVQHGENAGVSPECDERHYRRPERPGRRQKSGPTDLPDDCVSLTRDQVEHLAMLARLQLEEHEVSDVVSKLSRIVAFVDQLQAAPVDDVLPMAHPLNASQRLRPDRVTESIDREAIQANAPAVQDGFYLVPKVIE